MVPTGEVLGEEVLIGDVANSPEHEQTDNLLGVYEFNSRLSQAYKVVRFLRSPGMQELSSGFEESGAEHMWRASLLWDNIAGECPALAASVDSQHVSDLIMMHDIGEIFAGDVSRFVKAAGGAEDQFEAESSAVAKLANSLSPETQNKYVDMFREFENPDPQTRTRESVLANLIESIHGDFTFFDEGELKDKQVGDKFHTTDDMLEGTRRVVGKYTRPHIMQLISTFEAEGNTPAVEDMMRIVNSYCEYVANHRNPEIRQLAFTTEDLTTEPEA